jgi:hypothetical protein
MGRRKKDGNHSPPKNKVLQDLEWNEENGYPDPNFNKTRINYTKEPKEAHKNTLKEEILQIINDNVIEMLLDMVNKNVQEAGTEEIPREQKQRIWENTETNKWNHRSPK